ncbi:MAG: hypothetical protein AAF618_12205 [Pseudomonadota bacterium]
MLVVWLITTPALLLPDVSRDITEVVALLAICAGVLTVIEYGSNYPSFVDFRHAPPFNRVRFLSLFAIVFLLTVVCRGFSAPTAISDFVALLGGALGGLLDFPYSPVNNMILALPDGADPALAEAVRTLAGISYLGSLLSIGLIALIIRFEHWPGRYGTFNVWINLPTFDPTAGGDVVERLQRAGRVNLALGFLLPFLIPAVFQVLGDGILTLSLAEPQKLIWVMAAWAFLPSSLFMRGIAMGRVARLIEEKRRKRYAEFGEEGVLV